MRDFAIPALDIGLERGKVLVIDEVGFMQLTSTEFPFAVLRAFESECPVIATIPTASHPFVDALRKRDDVHIYTVTHGNRDALREVLRERVRAWVD